MQFIQRTQSVKTELKCNFNQLHRTYWDGYCIYAAPSVISVPLRIRQTDNIVAPSPIIVVAPPVIVVPIVVVIVVPSIYVGSALVWIDTPSALR